MAGYHGRRTVLVQASRARRLESLPELEVSQAHRCPTVDVSILRPAPGFIDSALAMVDATARIARHPNGYPFPHHTWLEKFVVAAL